MSKWLLVSHVLKTFLFSFYFHSVFVTQGELEMPVRAQGRSQTALVCKEEKRNNQCTEQSVTVSQEGMGGVGGSLSVL